MSQHRTLLFALLFFIVQASVAEFNEWQTHQCVQDDLSRLIVFSYAPYTSDVSASFTFEVNNTATIATAPSFGVYFTQESGNFFRSLATSYTPGGVFSEIISLHHTFPFAPNVSISVALMCANTSAIVRFRLVPGSIQEVSLSTFEGDVKFNQSNALRILTPDFHIISLSFPEVLGDSKLLFLESDDAGSVSRPALYSDNATNLDFGSCIDYSVISSVSPILIPNVGFVSNATVADVVVRRMSVAELVPGVIQLEEDVIFALSFTSDAPIVVRSLGSSIVEAFISPLPVADRQCPQVHESLPYFAGSSLGFLDMRSNLLLRQYYLVISGSPGPVLVQFVEEDTTGTLTVPGDISVTLTGNQFAFFFTLPRLSTHHWVSLTAYTDSEFFDQLFEVDVTGEGTEVHSFLTTIPNLAFDLYGCEFPPGDYSVVLRPVDPSLSLLTAGMRVTFAMDVTSPKALTLGQTDSVILRHGQCAHFKLTALRYAVADGELIFTATGATVSDIDIAVGYQSRGLPGAYPVNGSRVAGPSCLAAPLFSGAEVISLFTHCQLPYEPYFISLCSYNLEGLVSEVSLTSRWNQPVITELFVDVPVNTKTKICRADHVFQADIDLSAMYLLTVSDAGAVDDSTAAHALRVSVGDRWSDSPCTRILRYKIIDHNVRQAVFFVDGSDFAAVGASKLYLRYHAEIVECVSRIIVAVLTKIPQESRSHHVNTAYVGQLSMGGSMVHHLVLPSHLDDGQLVQVSLSVDSDEGMAPLEFAVTAHSPLSITEDSSFISRTANRILPLCSASLSLDWFVTVRYQPQEGLHAEYFSVTATYALSVDVVDSVVVGPDGVVDVVVSGTRFSLVRYLPDTIATASQSTGLRVMAISSYDRGEFSIAAHNEGFAVDRTCCRSSEAAADMFMVSQNGTIYETIPSDFFSFDNGLYFTIRSTINNTEESFSVVLRFVPVVDTLEVLDCEFGVRVASTIPALGRTAFRYPAFQSAEDLIRFEPVLSGHLLFEMYFEGDGDVFARENLSPNGMAAFYVPPCTQRSDPLVLVLFGNPGDEVDFLVSIVEPVEIVSGVTYDFNASYTEYGYFVYRFSGSPMTEAIRLLTNASNFGENPSQIRLSASFWHPPMEPDMLSCGNGDVRQTFEAVSSLNQILGHEIIPANGILFVIVQTHAPTSVSLNLTATVLTTAETRYMSVEAAAATIPLSPSVYDSWVVLELNDNRHRMFPHTLHIAQVSDGVRFQAYPMLPGTSTVVFDEPIFPEAVEVVGNHFYALPKLLGWYGYSYPTHFALNFLHPAGTDESLIVADAVSKIFSVSNGVPAVIRQSLFQNTTLITFVYSKAIYSEDSDMYFGWEVISGDHEIETHSSYFFPEGPLPLDVGLTGSVRISPLMTEPFFIFTDIVERGNSSMTVSMFEFSISEVKIDLDSEQVFESSYPTIVAFNIQNSDSSAFTQLDVSLDADDGVVLDVVFSIDELDFDESFFQIEIFNSSTLSLDDMKLSASNIYSEGGVYVVIRPSNSRSTVSGKIVARSSPFLDILFPSNLEARSIEFNTSVGAFLVFPEFSDELFVGSFFCLNDFQVLNFTILSESESPHIHFVPRSEEDLVVSCQYLISTLSTLNYNISTLQQSTDFSVEFNASRCFRISFDEPRYYTDIHMFFQESLTAGFTAAQSVKDALLVRMHMNTGGSEVSTTFDSVTTTLKTSHTVLSESHSYFDVCSFNPHFFDYNTKISAVVSEYGGSATSIGESLTCSSSDPDLAECTFDCSTAVLMGSSAAPLHYPSGYVHFDNEGNSSASQTIAVDCSDAACVLEIFVIDGVVVGHGSVSATSGWVPVTSNSRVPVFQFQVDEQSASFFYRTSIDNTPFEPPCQCSHHCIYDVGFGETATDFSEVLISSSSGSFHDAYLQMSTPNAISSVEEGWISIDAQTTLSSLFGLGLKLFSTTNDVSALLKIPATQRTKSSMTLAVPEVFALDRLQYFASSVSMQTPIGGTVAYGAPFVRSIVLDSSTPDYSLIQFDFTNLHFHDERDINLTDSSSVRDAIPVLYIELVSENDDSFIFNSFSVDSIPSFSPDQVRKTLSLSYPSSMLRGHRRILRVLSEDTRALAFNLQIEPLSNFDLIESFDGFHCISVPARTMTVLGFDIPSGFDWQQFIQVSFDHLERHSSLPSLRLFGKHSAIPASSNVSESDSYYDFVVDVGGTYEIHCGSSGRYFLSIYHEEDAIYDSCVSVSFVTPVSADMVVTAKVIAEDDLSIGNFSSQLQRHVEPSSSADLIIQVDLPSGLSSFSDLTFDFDTGDEVDSDFFEVFHASADFDQFCVAENALAVIELESHLRLTIHNVLSISGTIYVRIPRLKAFSLGAYIITQNTIAMESGVSYTNSLASDTEVNYVFDIPSEHLVDPFAELVFDVRLCPNMWMSVYDDSSPLPYFLSFRYLDLQLVSMSVPMVTIRNRGKNSGSTIRIAVFHGLLADFSISLSSRTSEPLTLASGSYESRVRASQFVRMPLSMAVTDFYFTYFAISLLDELSTGELVYLWVSTDNSTFQTISKNFEQDYPPRVLNRFAGSLLPVDLSTDGYIYLYSPVTADVWFESGDVSIISNEPVLSPVGQRYVISKLPSDLSAWSFSFENVNEAVLLDNDGFSVEYPNLNQDSNFGSFVRGSKFGTYGRELMVAALFSWDTDGLESTLNFTLLPSAAVPPDSQCHEFVTLTSGLLSDSDLEAREQEVSARLVRWLAPYNLQDSSYRHWFVNEDCETLLRNFACLLSFPPVDHNGLISEFPGKLADALESKCWFRTLLPTSISPADSMTLFTPTKTYVVRWSEPIVGTSLSVILAVIFLFIFGIGACYLIFRKLSACGSKKRDMPETMCEPLLIDEVNCDGEAKHSDQV